MFDKPKPFGVHGILSTHADEADTLDTRKKAANNMTDVTTTATEVAPKAPAKKTAKKAVPAKAAAKKGAKKAPAKKVAAKTESTAEYGLERSHDLPMNAKKAAIFKALKALGATKALGAVSAEAVAEKASTKDLEISNRDVRHYCYHAKAAGLAGVADDIEGIRGYAFYLTDKGVKVDVVAELKARQAKKAGKDE